MSSELSITGRKWVLRDESIPQDIHGLVQILADERGINFIEGPRRTLSDPFLFPEMERAVARIEKAIASKETIAIFGDYDADGITAAAQLVRFFRRHGAEPVVYLPDRLKEGYGMKKASIDSLKEKNVSLIITVDTGIAAHAEIAHAKSLGIDVIVTDHHRAQGGRPDAFAVIHPMIPSEFPNPHLCGSGVAFMLVRALEHGKIWDGIEQDIVLAAIGTIGDIMPLTGENRLLVVNGLKMIDKLPECPLKELIDDVRGQSGALTSGDIAFRVVPRLNAAGRMEHPSLALAALLTGGAALEKINQLNGDRRTAIEDALELVRPLVDWSQPFLFAASPDVSSGIVGLIAGRYTDQSGRPSLIASVRENLCVASLRSIPKIDVVSCLEHPAVRPHLLTFGGHAQAAGCSFLLENAEKIQAGLSQAVTDLGHTSETLLPELTIDRELNSAHASLALAKKLQSLAPFGQANTEPLFIMKNLRITNLRAIGSESTHLQMTLGTHRAIAFNFGSHFEKLAVGSCVDVACSLSVNVWNGRESLQLMIKDIRKSN